MKNTNLMINKEQTELAGKGSYLHDVEHGNTSKVSVSQYGIASQF